MEESKQLLIDSIFINNKSGGKSKEEYIQRHFPDEYVKIIKGKNEKVIKWDQVRKIKDERYNLGFSIYDENKHKTYVDFRTSNYAHIKEVMVKLHKENKHKAI